MVGPKIFSKLLPGDRRSIGGTFILKCFPPVLGFSLKLSWCVQHLLLVIALCYVELLFHCTKPIICFQWISGMREHWGTALQEFTMLIMRCSTNWMVLLILHQYLHELCLHCQKLLNSRWRWWWWMWGNTSMTLVSSSSRYLTSNTNIQNLEISKLEYILKNFWTSSNISSSVK